VVTISTSDLAKGKFTVQGEGSLTVLPDKARRLGKEVSRLSADVDYLYEDVRGNKVPVRFVGFQNLNALFTRTDTGEDYLAPILDMGDGSLFTNYLTRR
jgi:hypothetical protein